MFKCESVTELWITIVFFSHNFIRQTSGQIRYGTLDYHCILHEWTVTFFIEEALLGSVAQDEIKNLVVSCVSMCFEHDTDGEVQICRFHELREHYERHAIVLVEKRLPEYDKEVREVLRVMEILTDYDINGMCSLND